MASFLVPLFSVLLGAAIAIASSIFIERYRDRRSALSAALVIRDALLSVISVLEMAAGTLRPLRSLDARRFLDAWNVHNASLARSMSPNDWQKISSAFIIYDALSLLAEKRFDELPAPGAIEAATAYVPVVLGDAKAAVQTLESAFDLPEARISGDSPERDEILAAISPEFAEYIQTLHDEPPPSA